MKNAMRGGGWRRAAAGVWCGMLAVCVADDGPRKPSAAAVQPDWVRVTNISVTAEQPEDADADGYDDQVYVTAMLFDANYPPSTIRLEGAYLFTLVNSTGRAVAGWEISEAEVAGAWIRSPAGPMCRFRLPLKVEQARAVAGATLTVLAQFTDAQGRIEKSTGGATVTLRRPMGGGENLGNNTGATSANP